MAKVGRALRYVHAGRTVPRRTVPPALGARLYNSGGRDIRDFLCPRRGFINRRTKLIRRHSYRPRVPYVTPAGLHTARITSQQRTSVCIVCGP